MTTIPVIDFSKLDGEERAHTLAQISKGCEEWGFFQVFFCNLFIFIMKVYAWIFFKIKYGLFFYW